MKTPRRQKTWEKTNVANLLRHGQSGRYYARFVTHGKQVWRSLQTEVFSVAKLRLPDAAQKIRRAPAVTRSIESGRFTVGEAMEVYRQKLELQDQRPKTREFYLNGLKVLNRTWAALAAQPINRVTQNEIEAWLSRLKKNGTGFIPPGAQQTSCLGNSASTVRATLSVLRGLFDIAIKQGARFENPAAGLRSPPPRQKKLTLPTRLQFAEILESIRQAGAGSRSQAAHDLVAGLAYSGMRVGEARRLTWGHVDFEKRRLSVPGYKTASSARLVPFNTNLEALLQRMHQESPATSQDDRVFLFGEAQKALTAACQKVGATRLTHHDLRHFFATITIESGVDIPTVSRWLGHADGGALAMKTYGHLRDEHSTAAALKVSFN